MMPAMALLGALLAGQQCPVDECLEHLRTLTQVEVGQIEPAAVVGHWTRGPGFTGDELYLFEDRTYLATEWGCLQPETIHDKGAWTVMDGVLILTRDPDVTWPLRRFGNRRYVALRFGTEVRLFGLDGSLSLLARMVGADPSLPEASELVKHVSLAHSETRQTSGWRRVKAALLETAWKPSYFAGESAP